MVEGLIDGKVVVIYKVVLVWCFEKLFFWVDNEGIDLKVDGFDFVIVIVVVVDKDGNIKCLNNYIIKF